MVPILHQKRILGLGFGMSNDLSLKVQVQQIRTGEKLVLQMLLLSALV